MARTTSPKCKLCRREGTKLFLKGERCFSAKCALVKKKYPPGLHGPKGYPKTSEYGLQLREKQKIKRTYGILERQLKNYFRKAVKTSGNAEENLLKFLEQRLDNIVYRAGFAPSRAAARQIVNHGHIKVNNRRVDIPSFQVKTGDEINLRPTSKIAKKIRENINVNKGKIKSPDWLSLDENQLTIKILRTLNSEELPKSLNGRLIIEFYSR